MFSGHSISVTVLPNRSLHNVSFNGEPIPWFPRFSPTCSFEYFFQRQHFCFRDKHSRLAVRLGIVPVAIIASCIKNAIIEAEDFNPYAQTEGERRSS